MNDRLSEAIKKAELIWNKMVDGDREFYRDSMMEALRDIIKAVEESYETRDPDKT